MMRTLSKCENIPEQTYSNISPMIRAWYRAQSFSNFRNLFPLINQLVNFISQRVKIDDV